MIQHEGPLYVAGCFMIYFPRIFLRPNTTPATHIWILGFGSISVGIRGCLLVRGGIDSRVGNEPLLRKIALLLESGRSIYLLQGPLLADNGEKEY